MLQQARFDYVALLRMNATTDEQSGPFVPVSETLRENAERSRVATAWPRGELVGLALITLVAAAARFWQVEIWSVSAAEAETWRIATARAPGGFSPFDYGLRALFESGLLPPHGEGWLRLPFLFLGTLAVPVLALVGDALVGRRTALFAAGLLAVHPWHVEACQIATGHCVALTAAMMALASSFVASRTGHRMTWYLAIFFALLASLSHPIGWLVAPTVIACWQVEQWLQADRRGRVALIMGAGLVVVASVAAAFWFRSQGEAGSPVDALAMLPQWGMAAGLPVLVLGFLVPLLGAAGPRPRRRRYLLVAVVVPGLITLLTAAVAVAPMRDQALICLPPILLLAASGARVCFRHVSAALGGGRALRVVLPAALVALVMLVDLAVSTFLYATARRGSRPDWRGARDNVVRTAELPSVEVLAAAGHDSLLYYLRPDHWRAENGDPHPGIAVTRLDLLAPSLDAFAEAAVDRELFVVLLSGELAAANRQPAARAALASSFEMVEVLPCAGTQRDETVYVYRRRR